MLRKFWLRSDKTYWFKSFLILLGFVLTSLSYLKICTSACAEVHFYKIYGLDFEVAGFIFFISLAIVHVLSYTRPYMAFLAGLMVAGAVGSEINFILVQKYTIKMWCPLCLTIASTIGVLALTMVIEFFQHINEQINQGNKGIIMQSLWKGSATLSTLLIGFIIAFFGVAKPQHSFADGIFNQPDKDPIFGNRNSPVEVYIITDWLCPACRHREPTIEAALPAIMKVARVFFIEKVIHAESVNFIPYNVSFMVNDKDRYIETRHVLHELSDKTKTPTQQDVEEALKPLGIKYQPLNFADINSAMQFFEGINKSFEVTQTPTIVVANRKTLKAEKIMGDDINEAHIMKAIKEVQE